MQSLDVISINLWNVLISLANLGILYWVMKKFLYAPVRNMIAKRQAELDSQYARAAEAEEKANADRDLYAQKPTVSCARLPPTPTATAHAS